jgi:predicted acyl esterase
LRFDADTELTGYMKLRLWISCDANDDLDLFVGIRKFDRRGVELHFPDFNHIEHGLVARGWQRASHRELDEKRSTPYQPWLKHQRTLKLKPGEHAVPPRRDPAADRAGRRLQLHQIQPAAGQARTHSRRPRADGESWPACNPCRRPV